MNDLFQTTNEMTISEMTNRANESYHQSRESAKKAIEHAVECGRHLNQIKRALKHGAFQQWLECNFAGSKRTAQQYMRLANNPAIVEKSSNVSGAVALLQSPKAEPIKSAEAAHLNAHDPRVQFVMLQMQRVRAIKQQLAGHGCNVSDTGAVFDDAISMKDYEACGELIAEMASLIPLIESVYQSVNRDLVKEPKRQAPDTPQRAQGATNGNSPT